jgi:DNA-binding transcriptional ArsR family regulator
VRDFAVARQLWAAGSDDGRALASLLGRTRSAALQAIADGCTTSELAQLIGVSVSAASQHATVLRNAGLITTQRDGKAVVHTLTLLGSSLLNGEIIRS